MAPRLGIMRDSVGGASGMACEEIMRGITTVFADSSVRV